MKDIGEEVLLPSDWTTPICYHKEKENENIPDDVKYLSLEKPFIPIIDIQWQQQKIWSLDE